VDPVEVAAPNDGSGRLFGCERHGMVRVIRNGELSLRRLFIASLEAPA